MRKITKKLGVLFTVGVLAATAAGCSGTPSQQAGNKVYEVGVMQYADHPSLDNCQKGFIQGLKNKGFEEGKNLKLDLKAAQGDPAMNTQIAQNFANSRKDLVCGIATPSAQALYAVSVDKNIPVIFNAVNDPITAKLAVSETENMKGITGVSDKLPVEDQLKLIRELLPDAKKIGILYTTSEANSISTIQTYKELAPNYGFEIVEKGIAKQAEVAQAADVILPQVDCISNLTDNTVVSALGVLLEKANQLKIPVFGSEEEQVRNGCLASAGIDYIELGVMAGEMAGDVLNGKDISTIPFETVKESKITLNKKTAELLGITFSDDLISRGETVE